MSRDPSDKNPAPEDRQTEKYGEQALRHLAAEGVRKWNEKLRQAARQVPYSPTIGYAITARFYWLDVWCPGCRQVKQVDLRKLDRHEQTRVETLIPMLSCRACQPSPPFVQLLGLSEREWQGERRTTQT